MNELLVNDRKFYILIINQGGNLNYQKVRNRLQHVVEQQAEHDKIFVKMDFIKIFADGEHIDLFLKLAARVGSTSFELSHSDGLKEIQIAEFLSKLGLIEYVRSGDYQINILPTRKGFDLYKSVIEQVDLEETIEKQPFESEYVSF